MKAYHNKGLEWHFSWCSCYLYLFQYRCGQLMVKRWIDLLQTFFTLAQRLKQLLNESARGITNANGLGTSVMNEGQVLLLTMGCVI